jgi:DNA-binding transcriptional LysR family regulator
MIKDELSGLSVFLAVAERRSFTAAAAELDVTPSAVSQTVTALESRLGIRLLQRTTRSVGLTEAGQRFLARVGPAVADVHAALEEVDALRDRPAGTLRLNVPRVASRAIVEPMLARFLAAYPDIRVDVAIEDGLVDIVEQGFDAGIRLGETLDREVIAVEISGQERSAVVGAPSYFAARGVPRHPRDLQGHEFVNWRRITGRSIYRWEFTEEGREFEVAAPGRVTCNDVDLMLRLALDGVGLAYLLESTTREHVRAKRLVRVLERFCPPFPGLYLYYPSRVHVPPKLQALVDFLRKGASGRGRRWTQRAARRRGGRDR